MIHNCLCMEKIAYQSYWQPTMHFHLFGVHVNLNGEVRAVFYFLVSSYKKRHMLP